MAFLSWLEGAPEFSKALSTGGAFGPERLDVGQGLVEAGDQLVVGDDGLVEQSAVVFQEMVRPSAAPT